MNKRVHPLLDQTRSVRSFSAKSLRTALNTGVRVIDARSVVDFARGYLRGTVNVGFDGRFAETAGMVVAVGEPVALIAYPGEEQLAALRLARVGSDNVVGYLAVERGGSFPAELSDLVQQGRRTTAHELAELLADDTVTLIDVRNPGERELGAIPGSRHIPLAQLRIHLDEVPADKPIVVHCARLALECGRVVAARQRI
jgi:hypothetical protein